MDKREIFQFARVQSAKKNSSSSTKTSDCSMKCLRMMHLPAASSTSKRPTDKQTDQAAVERAVAALETEAVRRALAGVSVPVFHQGKECGSTVKHSDQLLMFLLKTLKPDRYGSATDSAQPQTRVFALDIELPGQDERLADEEPDGTDRVGDSQDERGDGVIGE